MSGFMFVIGHCIACGVYLTFNPHYVPSLIVEGQREPLCRGCHSRWNKIHRVDKGLEPITLHPEAYKEAEA